MSGDGPRTRETAEQTERTPLAGAAAVSSMSRAAQFRRRVRARWIAFALMCVCVGAVTTLLVSCAIQLWAPPPNFPHPARSAWRLSDETQGEPAGLIVLYELQERDRRLGQAVVISCSFRDKPTLLNADEESESVIPAWAEHEFRRAFRTLETPPKSDGPMPSNRDNLRNSMMVSTPPSCSINGFGWPFIATSVYHAIDTTPQPSGQLFTIRTNGLSLPKSIADRLRTQEDTLAISPVWPGFALNTLFYATLFATPAPLLHWHTRRNRRRAGHCEKCNYNLAGLASGAACPECGASSAPSRVKAQTP
ncbi:MAG: hypothetical protein IBJ18_13340 [Phycisphaerales bacterium]|nr:hypothetical protein [Phycisphaerales bacterium]